MKRSACLLAFVMMCGVFQPGAPAIFGAHAYASSSDSILPVGSAPEPVALPWFPDRVHAFVFRNWNLVETERLAKVLGTSAENVAALAESMGLPPARPVSAEQRARGYITLIRRNWHLLPYEQLLVLLDMNAQQLADILREDDFLYSKLGLLKPRCEPLRYAEPNDAAKQRAAEIRRVIEETFGEELRRPEEPRFQFVERFRRVEAGAKGGAPPPSSRQDVRFIYSYFALYGDPLMNPQLDPYPDGLLQRLSELGVNGIWIHTVLRQLAPSRTFPEFGAGHQERLKNLRELVQRARRHGIGVYLYMNEPRAMPVAFFENRPGMKGVREGDHIALCTSAPEVRQWLADSLAFVFENVPELAGVFTITASENLTNCASHNGEKSCPRCKDRTPAEIIAEVNAAIEAGVHRGSSKARVLAWDWGWSEEWTPDAIARLPKSVWLMSVSEWSKRIRRGGIETAVGEYSLSAVGPGPRATKHWALAKSAGLKTAAKVQLNNTWEISTVPYLPVMDLVAEHCSRLTSAGVDGMMLSWSLGGYPSPNLEIARRFSERPNLSVQDVLDAVARERFGADGAPHARRAWTAFSRAFGEYPFNGTVIYNCPVQVGPANPLYFKPTGYKATMTGIPYDDLDGWRGPYPAAVLAAQFENVATGWKEGLEELKLAGGKAPAERRAEARDELRFAEAAGIHFASVANQVRFTLARNALAGDAKTDSAARKARIEEMKSVASREIELARRLFALCREDSRIGFEAANQYFYVPTDLMEKVVNCRYIVDSELR
jgi:hypothetical protein